MTQLEARNALNYAMAILAGSLAAALLVLSTQLAGADPINWRPILLAALGPILTGLVTTQLTRTGFTQIAAQADYLQAQGLPKHELVVLHESEAAPALAGGLTPTAVQQVGDAVGQRVPSAREIAEAYDGLRRERVETKLRGFAESRDPIDGTPPLPPAPEGH